MAKRLTGGQILENMSGGSGINYREIMVDLKPDPVQGKTTRRLRLIGLPIEYWEVSPRKKEEGTDKTYQCPFPDAELNRAFTRICNDNLEDDPWIKMGYIKTKRYAINCIDRDEGKVKILAKGKSIFGEFYKTEKANAEENIELAANEESLLWTSIGGEEAPDTKIIANYNEKALGKVVYEVRYSPKVNKLTSEEIEQLKAVGQPSAEQLKQMRTENPALKDCPDWFFYGYDLEKIFKPSVLRTANETTVATTPVEEMEIKVSEDETPETTKTAKKSPKKQEAEVTEDVTVVEDVEEDTEEVVQEVEW